MTSPDLASLIRRLATERPDAPALSFQGATYTFADLDRRSDRAAAALVAAGVADSDRVAFIDKNCVEFFDVIFACSKVNAVFVPLNWRLTPAEMLGILADAGPRFAFLGPDFGGLLEADTDKVLSDATVIALHPGDWSGEAPTGYDGWLAPEGTPVPATSSAPDGPYMQLYTSGTTGVPKGVVLGNRTAGKLRGLGEEIGYTSDSVLLMVLPLFHTSYSIPLAAMAMGARTVLHREVDLPAALADIPAWRVTHAGFVPALLAALNSLSQGTKYDFSSLELIMYGASPISETVLRDSIGVFGCAFAQLYGLTESGGTIAILTAEDHDPDGRPELLRSLGKPLAFVEMRIVDPESGTDRPDGEVGELLTRSAQNMIGYAGRPEDTAGALDAEGWLRTGDLGYRDGGGYFYLNDRLKDMIVSGAENVYPAEVENALMAHPGIADVAVIGVPSERWGETVKAIVLPAGGEDVSEREVIDFARGRLTHYKCPTSVDFVTDPLPRNPSGKLLKRIIREPYWAGQSRRIT